MLNRTYEVHCNEWGAWTIERKGEMEKSLKSTKE